MAAKKSSALFLSISLIGCLLASPSSNAQATGARQPATKPAAAKPVLNKQETFEYIRGKMLSLATRDGSNGYTEALFVENECKIVANWEDGRTVDYLLGSLDAGTAIWGVFDAVGNNDKLLELTFIAQSSQTGSQFKKRDGTSYKLPGVTFLFSLPKAAEIPDFQTKMTKATKHMIVLCGGKPETNDF